MIGHGITVAGIGGVFVGAHQVARRRQTETASGAAAEDDGFGFDHMKVSAAAIKAHHAVDRAVGIGEQPGSDHPVGDVHPRAFELAVQHLFDVVAFGHGQHVGAHVVNLLDRVIAGFVFLKLHAPAVQLLDGFEAVGGIGVHGGLVDDAVVGHGDFFGVLLGRGMAWNDGVVQAVHAHADGAAAFDVGFIQQQHAQVFVAFLGLDRRHGASRAAANNDDVVLAFNGWVLAHTWRPL